DVAHDAGDEDAGFVGVVKRDGETANVRLNLFTKVGDHALRGFGEQLREGKGGEPLDDGGGDDGKNDGREEMSLSFADYIVDKIFGGGGKNLAGEPVDAHKAEAEDKQSPEGM